MIHVAVWTIFLLASLIWLLPAAQADEGWKAGVAKVSITPEKLLWMSGYSSRNKPAEGKLHDLWAKAIALEVGPGQRAVLVTLDLVGIPRNLSESICQKLKSEYGLNREAVWINVSHTHCGPVVGSNLLTMFDLSPEQKRDIIEYAGQLEAKIVAVVGKALLDLKPAKLSYGTGTAGFAVNRRNNKEPEVPELRRKGELKGPNDHSLPVLAVRGTDGRLRAIVCGYACHATVLSFYQWCGDWPGFAMLELEKSHPDCVALFWAGCGADQNPLPRRSVPLAEEYGQQLAASVNKALSGTMKPVSPNLTARYREIPLRLAELPNREKLVEDSMSKEKYVAIRAKVLLNKLEDEKSLAQSYPYPIQAWRLGKEVTVTTLGGEVVVDYALRIKRELAQQGAELWVSGYSNDVMAYIPSLRVLKEGGYEGASSMVYYGLPTVWAPSIEEDIMKAVGEIVSDVRK